MPLKNRQLKNEKHIGIIIANDLRSGLTVFLTASGKWSTLVADAWIAEGEESVNSALETAASAESSNQVTGAYLVSSNDHGNPVDLREALRVQGPSIDYLANNSMRARAETQAMAVGQAIVGA